MPFGANTFGGLKAMFKEKYPKPKKINPVKTFSKLVTVKKKFDKISNYLKTPK